ncbi:MAG TPA: DoxX family protein [Sphingopyxis sp.]|uniref:DoxX family protein n=1 Tax=Sphingopyxis sp. TaxID=1908224 RepID=UPI002E1340D3|nr:DoxX family protein [Sphingopyxis sp.]
MRMKIARFPSSSRLTRPTILFARVMTAGLFMAHAVVRVANGTIPRFGQFMEGQGFPAGEALVWAITLTELVAGFLMIVGRFVRPAAAALLAIAVGGIVLIHRHAGWFVGEHGTGGVEYSAALIILLLLIMADDQDRQPRLEIP